MFDDRLPTAVWADALIRRAQLEGAGVFVLQKGEASRGDVLLKVATLDGQARAYRPQTNMAGDRVFLDLTAQGIGPDERQIDAYLSKAKARDFDLWIIEIEDREGRHFLTEPVETLL
ncbi:MAG: DUF1491 family protein [Pseudomonadota bacterium]